MWKRFTLTLAAINWGIELADGGERTTGQFAFHCDRLRHAGGMGARRRFHGVDQETLTNSAFPRLLLRYPSPGGLSQSPMQAAARERRLGGSS